MTNDIVFTKTINGTAYQLTIFTSKLDINLQKTLIVVPTFTSTKNQGTMDPTDPDFSKKPKVVDLLNIQKRFEIEGYVETSTVASDSETTAVGKRNLLLNMMMAGGTATITYVNSTVTESYIIAIDKITTTEEPHDEGDVTIIKIKVSCLEATDIPLRST